MPRRLTTTQRGYDHHHQQLRAHWQRTITTQGATCTATRCLMPTRLIPPGAPWHLGHDRATGTHRGPEHPRCNTSEGAAYGNRLRGHRTNHPTKTWHSTAYR